jgi:hypothetical protein
MKCKLANNIELSVIFDDLRCTHAKARKIGNHRLLTGSQILRDFAIYRRHNIAINRKLSVLARSQTNAIHRYVTVAKVFDVAVGSKVIDNYRKILQKFDLYCSVSSACVQTLVKQNTQPKPQPDLNNSRDTQLNTARELLYTCRAPAVVGTKPTIGLGSSKMVIIPTRTVHSLFRPESSEIHRTRRIVSTCICNKSTMLKIPSSNRNTRSELTLAAGLPYLKPHQIGATRSGRLFDCHKIHCILEFGYFVARLHTDLRTGWQM